MSLTTYKSAVLARLRHRAQATELDQKHCDQLIEAAWLAELSDLEAADMVQRCSNYWAGRQSRLRSGPR